MKSLRMYELAMFLLKNQNEMLTSKEIEIKFAISRASLLSCINSLREIHGFKIINRSSKGRVALYQLIGFEEPKGRGITKIRRINKKAKTKIDASVLPKKPRTFHPLIERVFR